MPTDLLGKLVRMLSEARQRALERKHRRSVPDGPIREVSEALDQLRARTLPVRRYLAIKIDEAVKPVAPLLAADDIAFIRALLWERLVTDSALSALVQGITGTELEFGDRDLDG